MTEASPCIDRGTSAGAPPEDIDGNSRPQGEGYDIGSDEYVSDNDGDGIPDIVEIDTGTDPYDDDTDDDGLLDGPGSGEDTNANGVVDPGETDPRNPDSDGDGLQDGIEKGLTEPEGFDTDMTIFKADADPSTTTDPLNPDTDDDGTLDGNDVCPNDPNKIQPGICGCAVADTDSDKYLLGDGMLAGTDWLNAGSYIWREFMATYIRSHGNVALWWPALLCGQPTVAGFFADMFYPTLLLRLFLPVHIAWTWTFVIHHFLAGLGTYLFLRELKLSVIPAALGGIAYELAGSLITLAYAGHDGRLIGSALMPLALYFLHRGMTRRQFVWFALTRRRQFVWFALTRLA